MDITNIAVVVLYVLPGFLATELRYFLVPARKGSDFERLVWSVFFSLIGYGGAWGVAQAVYLGRWRQHATARDVWFVVLVWVVALVAAVLIAEATRRPPLKAALSRLLRVKYSEFPSVWNEIGQCPEEAPFVRVHLSDGTSHLGEVHAYTRDPAEEQRELWLRPVRAMDENGHPTQKLVGLGLFVRAVSIIRAEVYRPEDRPEAGTTA